MATKNIKQWTVLSCSPETAYKAWMDSKKHGEMIDGSAKIDPKVGGAFSIWDGAVKGKTIELDPKKHRIIQEWRYEYEDWPQDQPSKIIIEFVPHENGCKLRFWQSKVPEKYASDIAQGWKDYYWKSMQEYFKRSE